METTLDILFHALETARETGEISEEQYTEAHAYLIDLKG